MMSQRSMVKACVMQMHEKNLVLMNILRDIAENETSCELSPGMTENEIARRHFDKEARLAEILGEIREILLREDRARIEAAMTLNIHG